MRFDYNMLHYEEKQVAQFTERIRQAKEQLESEQIELDQKRAFLEAKRAGRRSLGLGGDHFGTSVEVPQVQPTLGVITRANRFKQEVIALREELERVSLQAEKEKREQYEEASDLQRQAASPYIPHARLFPQVQLSQPVRFSVLAGVSVVTTERSVTATYTLAPMREHSQRWTAVSVGKV